MVIPIFLVFPLIYCGCFFVERSTGGILRNRFCVVFFLCVFGSVRSICTGSMLAFCVVMSVCEYAPAIELNDNAIDLSSVR